MPILQRRPWVSGGQGTGQGSQGSIGNSVPLVSYPELGVSRAGGSGIAIQIVTLVPFRASGVTHLLS